MKEKSTAPSASDGSIWKLLGVALKKFIRGERGKTEQSGNAGNGPGKVIFFYNFSAPKIAPSLAQDFL